MNLLVARSNEAVTPFNSSTVQQFKVRVAEIPIASIVPDIRNSNVKREAVPGILIIGTYGTAGVIETWSGFCR
jgi:hypothetical protein